MKRRLGILTLLIGAALAGCGGSSSTPPPPPTGGFSDASLSGQYAFSMAGADATTGAYLARVGSFIADGNGKITAAMEDVVALGSTPPAAVIVFSGGTYEIQANGRGVLVLSDSNGGGLQLYLEMNSISQGTLIQTDLNASTTGSFSKQNSSDFTNSAIAGNYVFDVNGVEFSNGGGVAPISIAGQFGANGNQVVTGGTIDINDGNVSAPSGAISIDPGAYQLDTTAAGSTFGRGTATFAGTTFAYYIIDSSHISLIEEDQLGGAQGDAFLQSSNVPTQNSQFTGNFAFLVGGASVLGSQGAVARGARLTADGGGNLSTVVLTDNNNGTVNRITANTTVTNATYDIDTAYAGSGRGTMTFTTSGLGTFTYVFYLVSPTHAVIQDTSPGIIADGLMLAQTGAPYSQAGLDGSYTVNWNGVQLGPTTSAPYDIDFLGQYTLTSDTTQNISGVADYTQLGLTIGQLVSNVGLTGYVTLVNDGSQANNVRYVAANSSSSTYNFDGFLASPNTMFVVSSDANRVSAGIATQQITPE